ncbi:MAG: cupin domain-containing protein [Solirubrobacteraceae bacterium]
MADYTAKRFDEMDSRMGGSFKLARAGLGVSAFGMQVIDMPPNSGEHYPNHDHLHDGQEEVYVVLRGGGVIEIEGERVALGPDTAVRVGPDTKRQLHAGAEGMRVLVIGGVPGGVYEPPAFTEPEPPVDDPPAAA